jgi:hypothetical protein
VSEVPADPVATIDDVVAQMQGIQQALPPKDGLGAFNRMYLEVTESVRAHIGADFFAAPAFMTRLDVVFANRYFAAVSAAQTGATVPRAWDALLARRHEPGIEPIQFALAGMNAHINFDLAQAVVATCEEQGTQPDTPPLPADYQKVNELLDEADQQVRESFEHGVVLDTDRRLAPVENVVGDWSIKDARAAAWVRARAIWQMRSEPELERDYLDSLDVLVATAGVGILAPRRTDLLGELLGELLAFVRRLLPL